MKTSKVPLARVPLRMVCPILCNVQPWEGRALLCAGNTGPGLPGPHPKETLGASEGSPRKAEEGEEGWGWVCGPALAPGSEATKETGKKDALGTSFAFVF